MSHRFKKRERTQNWSPEEKILLLKLCEDKFDVLETKRSDQISIAKKSNAWREIRAEFVAALGIDRDLSRLKEQWQRMKCQARSDLQDFAIRLRKFGPQVANQKRPNQMSTEVWRVMENARKYFLQVNGTDGEEDSCVKEINWSLSETNCNSDNPEPLERDTVPSLLCETEVKIHPEDSNSQNIDSMNNELLFFQQFTGINGSLDTGTESKQNEMDYYAKRDFVLSALANAQNRNEPDISKTNDTSSTETKGDNEINKSLLLYFEGKKLEQQKRLLLMEEQMKTARIHRETAEIQMQIAQQQLKYTLLKYNNKSDDLYCKESRSSIESDDYEHNCKKIKEDINDKVSYHQEQIRCHQEAISKHKKRLLEIQTE